MKGGVGLAAIALDEINVATTRPTAPPRSLDLIILACRCIVLAFPGPAALTTHQIRLVTVSIGEEGVPT